MITANRFFKSSWNTYNVMVIVPTLVQKGILEMGVDTLSPLLTYVNHGRWVVKCECGGAEKAWEEGFFMCQSCFNAGHKHQYRKSVFPKDRVKIEELLSLRSLPNRNWLLGETINDLEAENKEHKAELLEVR